jgi:polar amino acid transport system substrate-binding protein
VRVGVIKGSTSQGTLPNILPNATVVPAQNSRHAIEMFERRELDVFATNKPTLFEMSDQMPDARVLDGRWGVEHIAIAIPKGREAAMEYLHCFVAEVQTSGLLHKPWRVRASEVS